MTDLSWGQVFVRISWRRKLILVICALVATATLVISFYAIGKILSLVRQRSLEEEALERHAKHVETAPAFAHPLELRDISVALTDKRVARSAYAQFTLVLDCPNAESVHLLQANRSKIVDGILEAAGYMKTDDFKYEHGFQTFKMHMKAIFGHRFGDLAPRDVVIQNWFMQ